MDAEELGRLGGRSGGGGLGFQAGEQRLEPLERGRVLADPDELDTAQAARRVGPRAQVPDVLEDGRPRRDADAGADQDGDLVVEDVLRGGAVGPVDAQLRHRLPVLQRDLVHPHRVQAVVFFGLQGPAAQGVAERAREVADLPHVHGDVRVEGTGGYGEGVPLRRADGGDL